MKLLLFPGSFVPHIGGLETHVDEFTKYFSSYADITVFAPMNAGGEEFEVRHGSVQVIRYPCIRLFENMYIPNMFSLTFWRLLRRIRGKYDFTMTRTRFFPNSLLGFLYSKWHGIRNVHVEHGSSHFSSPNKLLNWIGWLVDKTVGSLIIKRSFLTIAISQAVKDFLHECFGVNAPIITRGVDFSAYSSIRAVKKDPSRIRIGFVGRLIHWKGVQNSAEAYLGLEESLRSRAEFVVVGEGEVTLPEGIVCVGKKSFSEAIAWMKSFDVYVHSAYPGGGLSNSLLQAMYLGCTIVASPHEGGKEVVSNSFGVLLKDNSVAEIRRGLRKVLRQKTFTNEKATAYIKREFSWEEKCEEYLRLMQ